MSCETCVHLGDQIFVADYEDDECGDVGTSFYVCNKMIMATDGGQASKESLIDNKPVLACATGSGSGYERFLVEKAFFCALYEQKEVSK
jgi:hypothetical protein